MEQKFTNKELVKVMLQVKKEHGKELSTLEKKYDSELPEVSPNDKKNISEELMHKSLIFSHKMKYGMRRLKAPKDFRSILTQIEGAPFAVSIFL